MTLNDNENFEPLVVLQLSLSTPTATKEWVLQRITANRNEDEGAGLLARFEPDPENTVKHLFFYFRFYINLDFLINRQI